MPYVNQRWLGGTLTNNFTIRKSITKLKQLTKMSEDGSLDALSKKEASRKTKKLSRLSFYLEGIKDMIALPEAVFIVDTKKEQLAVDEANKLNIPIIGIIDTNADPTEVQYPIPANDDAIRAIKLLCSVMANAVLEINPQMIVDTNDSEEEGKPSIPSKDDAQTKDVKPEVPVAESTEVKEVK